MIRQTVGAGLVLALPLTAWSGLGLVMEGPTAATPGAPLTLVVRDGHPGASVRLVRGQPTGFVCPAILAGSCLSLTNPVVVATATADSLGTARFVLPLPSTLPTGLTPRFQAAYPLPTESGMVSQPLDVTLIAQANCSNGIWEAPEACDDGDLDPWNGCASTCTPLPPLSGPLPGEYDLEVEINLPFLGRSTDSCSAPLSLAALTTSDGVTRIQGDGSCALPTILGGPSSGDLSVQGTVTPDGLLELDATLSLIGSLVSIPVQLTVDGAGLATGQSSFGASDSGATVSGLLTITTDLNSGLP